MDPIKKLTSLLKSVEYKFDKEELKKFLKGEAEVVQLDTNIVDSLQIKERHGMRDVPPFTRINVLHDFFSHNMKIKEIAAKTGLSFSTTADIIKRYKNTG